MAAGIAVKGNFLRSRVKHSLIMEERYFNPEFRRPLLRIYRDFRKRRISWEEATSSMNALDKEAERNRRFSSQKARIHSERKSRILLALTDFYELSISEKEKIVDDVLNAPQNPNSPEKVLKLLVRLHHLGDERILNAVNGQGGIFSSLLNSPHQLQAFLEMMFEFGLQKKGITTVENSSSCHTNK